MIHDVIAVAPTLIIAETVAVRVVVGRERKSIRRSWGVEAVAGSVIPRVAVSWCDLPSELGFERSIFVVEGKSGSKELKSR